jgi:hypothetical protein
MGVRREFAGFSVNCADQRLARKLRLFNLLFMDLPVVQAPESGRVVRLMMKRITLIQTGALALLAVFGAAFAGADEPSATCASNKAVEACDL